MFKFPKSEGVITLHSSRVTPVECQMQGHTSGVPNGHRILIRACPRNPVAEKKGIKVAIYPEYTYQTITIGGSLTEKGRMELCDLLKNNLDVFAWKPLDMIRVPRSLVEHQFNIREGCPPLRQKKRGQALDKSKAINEEVSKLVEAGIIREVYYHNWISNLMLVKKHDDSWRMCVDFTDLNKSYPQDRHRLPGIDWKVKPLCRYPFKCFLDAYIGYHQMQMTEEDEEK
nr:reverse transcriptase domain-containing protein [Tanacetum cinerariifolium]